MKKQLLAGVSALALVGAVGIGAANANPTVKNVEDISSGGGMTQVCLTSQCPPTGGEGGDISIGTVEIEVELEQEIESLEGGSADGGEGGDDNWADADATGTANAGNGGMGGTGGNATATNTASLSIENGNVVVLSENDLYAVNELEFDTFIETGGDAKLTIEEALDILENGDEEEIAELEEQLEDFEEGDAKGPELSGGSAKGGDGGDAESDAESGEGIEADAEASGDADSYAGNAWGGDGGNAKGGDGGHTITGDVHFATGTVSYNSNTFGYAAGQFNVGGNTGIAVLNQSGNAVAAHVPVGVSVTKP